MSIEVSEEDGVRYLHFGSRWIQGAMRIARPYALELEYTRDLMFPLLLHRGGWLRIVLADGTDYIAAADRDFDLIVVDGYDAKGRTGMLDTLPFYCNCQAHLT